MEALFHPGSLLQLGTIDSPGLVHTFEGQPHPATLDKTAPCPGLDPRVQGEEGLAPATGYSPTSREAGPENQ